MARPPPTRPPSWRQLSATSSADLITDCPLPGRHDGLDRAGIADAAVDGLAQCLFGVDEPVRRGRQAGVSAARRRMPSRFMVSWAARAVGVTRTAPAASSSTSRLVAMASISGTMTCGRSWSMILRKASASVMGTTWARCATCGASAYRSTAMTSTPRRCRAMTTSLPSSPEPSSITRVARGDRGVPRTGLEMRDMRRSWVKSESRKNRSRQDAIPLRGQTRFPEALRASQGRLRTGGAGSALPRMETAPSPGIAVSHLGLRHLFHASWVARWRRQLILKSRHD